MDKKALDLSHSYETDFASTIRERLQQAGVRLGALLNDIFDPK